MKTWGIRKAAAGLVLVAALAFLFTGVRRSHKAYDPESEAEFGLLIFETISDGQLVEDATFGGVKRVKDRLFSTYDRSQPRGKQPCLT